MLDFGGRVVLVTGAGRGMGRDYARTLAERGARVIVNDVDAESAASVVAEITALGGTAVGDTHSVVDDATRVVGTAIEAFGQLDAVINNAAIMRAGAFTAQDPAEWWRIFDTSFKGTVEISQAAWPHLVESGEGRLVNVTSSSMLGSPGTTAYAAAKAAIWGFSNSLSEDGAKVGVRVYCIMLTAWTPLQKANISWLPEVEATMSEEFTTQRVADFVTWLVHPDTRSTNEKMKTFRVGGGHVRRAMFAVAPEARPTADSPEGWAEATDQVIAEHNEVIHFWGGHEMMARELVTANPALADVIKNGMRKA